VIPWERAPTRAPPVLPRRWVVERTLPWLTTHRRPARDYERLPEHAQAWVKWAMIGVMTRRLARVGAQLRRRAGLLTLDDRQCVRGRGGRGRSFGVERGARLIHDVIPNSS